MTQGGHEGEPELTFIFGSPRSGTTWLGKILDSHPGVRYLHEPEISVPPDLPQFAPDDGDHARLARARDLIRTWERTLSVRTTGTRPVFRKAGERASRHAARGLGVYAAKVLHRVWRLNEDVPRLPDPMPRGARMTVIKTVNLLGRAQLLMAAAPTARCVYLVRHPAGQIASELRGIAKFGATSELTHSAIPHAPLARRAGIDLDALSRMSPTEILAWKWAAFNDAAHTALKADSRAVILRYEDLAADPEATARKLFTDLGLTWTSRVAGHIAASYTASEAARHYAIKRNPDLAATRWTRELTADQIDTITGICGRSEVGRSLFGLAAPQGDNVIRFGLTADAPERDPSCIRIS